jgi:plastocyanin
MRKLILALTIVVLAASASLAEELTLPAAASIVGASPVFSDVRVFNTSYTASLDVTMTYRCFIGCGAAAAPVTFTLAPRQSQAFNDIVVSQFASPNTAGGIEFEFSGVDEQLVVTSRLYSTEPEPTVGMFIPALPNSEAYPTTVLTSIQNGGPNLGFRTNVGVFNRDDSATDVTFRIFDNGAQVGNAVTRSVPGHSGVQVNNVFNAAGQGSLVTNNAVIVVTASHEIFSYAAVIDNNTTDPIFVIGAEDQSASSAPQARTVQVGDGGTVFSDDVTHSNISEIHVGDTVTWVWDGTLAHGVMSGNCNGGGGGGGGYILKGYGGGDDCSGDGRFASGSHTSGFEFSHTFTEAGSFAYFCPIHGAAMKGRVVVGTAPAPKKRAAK